MARTAAGSHSGMDGYELHGHLREQLFSAIVDYFANFSSSVGSVSEEIYSLQAVYFSYTYRRLVLRCLQQLADRCNHVLQLTEIFC